MPRLLTLIHTRLAFMIGSLLWLPVGVVLTMFVFFTEIFANPGTWEEVIPELGWLLIVALCGLPLALACRQLWRFGYRTAAWAAMLVIGAPSVWITVLVIMFAVEWSSIVPYNTVSSLPVWTAVGIEFWRRKNVA